MGKDKFELVEKYLYRREYETSTGEYSVLYYGNFVDWKKVRRRFPLGDSLEVARDRLGELRNLNGRRFDFDAEKAEQKKSRIKEMTLGEWLDKFLDLYKKRPANTQRSVRTSCNHLKRLLGEKTPLSAINKLRILEYKVRRSTEKNRILDENGESGTVIGSTINNEVSVLITALNLAAETGLCQEPPKIKMEREFSRNRILDAQEYQALLDNAPTWFRRVMIAMNEAALDVGVLIDLTWDQIKGDLLVATRQKTLITQKVGISPEFKSVLDELRREYDALPNLRHLVFTKNGKSLNRHTPKGVFKAVAIKAKVKGFQLRDFRHCCRTRWASNGLPFEIAEMGLGHKISGIAGVYLNLQDDHVLDAFRAMFTRCSQKKIAAVAAEKRMA